VPDADHKRWLAQFARALPEAQRIQADLDDQELAQELERLLALAEQALPKGITLDPPRLLEYMAQRIPEHEDLLQALRRLHVGELTLAMACAEGSAEAIAELERRHFSIVDDALAKMPEASQQVQEIKQQLRQRLLVRDGDRPPRIAQYSGRGPLRSWLRVAGIRCAINLVHKQGREVELQDDILVNLAASSEDQELGHLKEQYRAEFKRAFERALASLSSQQRNVMRYHYLDRLNIDQIGKVYGVHRTTVARWLAKTREQLLKGTRGSLMAQLKIERTEFESIMRLIQSQLDASIERFLETRPDSESE
jgi:RNA polymerase sigma-70 factor (ECF subfamily)